MLVRRIAKTAAMTGALVVLTAGPALAHDCYNTQKAAGSRGSVGTYTVATDTFVPSGATGNPAFVEIVFPDGRSAFLFVHSGGEKNDHVVPGAKDCDGKGLDAFSACMS
jgi:hypothetical protein